MATGHYRHGHQERLRQVRQNVGRGRSQVRHVTQAGQVVGERVFYARHVHLGAQAQLVGEQAGIQCALGAHGSDGVVQLVLVLQAADAIRSALAVLGERTAQFVRLHAGDFQAAQLRLDHAVVRCHLVLHFTHDVGHDLGLLRVDRVSHDLRHLGNVGVRRPIQGAEEVRLNVRLNRGALRCNAAQGDLSLLGGSQRLVELHGVVALVALERIQVRLGTGRGFFGLADTGHQLILRSQGDLQIVHCVLAVVCCRELQSCFGPFHSRVYLQTLVHIHLGLFRGQVFQRRFQVGFCLQERLGLHHDNMVAEADQRHVRALGHSHVGLSLHACNLAPHAADSAFLQVVELASLQERGAALTRYFCGAAQRSFVQTVRVVRLVHERVDDGRLLRLADGPHNAGEVVGLHLEQRLVVARQVVEGAVERVMLDFELLQLGSVLWRTWLDIAKQVPVLGIGQRHIHPHFILRGLESHVGVGAIRNRAVLLGEAVPVLGDAAGVVLDFVLARRHAAVGVAVRSHALDAGELLGELVGRQDAEGFGVVAPLVLPRGVPVALDALHARRQRDVVQVETEVICDGPGGRVLLARGALSGADAKVKAVVQTILFCFSSASCLASDQPSSCTTSFGCSLPSIRLCFIACTASLVL